MREYENRYYRRILQGQLLPKPRPWWDRGQTRAQRYRIGTAQAFGTKAGASSGEATVHSSLRECKGHKTILQANLFHGEIIKDNGTFFKGSVRRQNKTPVPTAKNRGLERSMSPRTSEHKNYNLNLCKADS